MHSVPPYIYLTDNLSVTKSHTGSVPSLKHYIINIKKVDKSNTYMRRVGGGLAGVQLQGCSHTAICVG